MGVRPYFILEVFWPKTLEKTLESIIGLSGQTFGCMMTDDHIEDSGRIGNGDAPD